MGLLKQAAGLRRRLQQLWHARDPHSTSDRLRVCRVEELEPRNLMAADVPNINVGIHYYEADGGQDTAGDRFEITFNGGAPGTQLQQIVIDTDKAGEGLTVGDAFFDTAAGGQGASLAFPFTVVDQTGITSVQHAVSDGGTLLTLDFTGFDVGERFVFSIDVDEKGFSENSSNAIVEGEEFEASKMFATFTAPHFFDTKTSATDPPRFFDSFTFAGTGLNLPPDAYIPPGGGAAESPVRTAGVKAVLTPTPLPITISGTVFEDVNLNNVREGSEPGISGVSLALLELDGSVYVATGKTATTNALGQYKFEGVLPGTYRVAETQPGGYFSVGAQAGTVSGAVVGTVTSVDVLSDIALLGGQDSINNDFGEARPANLSGHVYHDADDDGVRDAGEEGIGNAKIVLERLASTNPALAATFVEVFSDSTGFWSATGLRPGNYVVREVQPAGYFDGKDRAGSLGGTAVNPGDEINSVFLASGNSGVNYDFGELKPVGISGMVHTDVDFDCILDPNETPLAGVTIFLLDAAGNRIPGKSTTTKADGTYEFVGLPPGTYGVEEAQPAGYFDGGDSIGSNGGILPRNDVIAGVKIGSGQMAVDYNFCEHPPASIAGRVYVDDNDNGLIDSGEVGIGGVTLQLLDAAGAATGATTTTAADGTYSFTGLAPGVYGVAEVQPGNYYDGKDAAGTAGGTALNPGDRITGASLAPAQAGQNYNFGELRPASISGRVHRDEDGDCMFDPEEQPLSGVTIFLLDAAGSRIATTTTNNQGVYTFANLKPGTYGVEEITPPGVFDGDEMVGSHGGAIVANDKIEGALLKSGSVAVNYDFCENAPVTLAGRVYADDNDNGLIDPGEVGIGGVTLQLLDAAGNITGTTTTTAADGSYLFTGLAPGVYGVAETQPSAYFDGKDAAGSAGGTALNPGDRITGAKLDPGVHGKQYNFGELRPASIRGLVHADVDGDCVLDPGEAPLGGVTILLLDASGATLATTKTAADGTYQFTNLKPGVYGVREEQPAGYFDGEDMVGSAGGVAGNDLLTQVSLGAGVNAVDYNFCEEPPASISGMVHADKDGDCELDADETPLEGVTIFLLDAAGNRIASTKTNAQGRYSFTGLEPDKVYGVEEVTPAGYFDGEDMVGSEGGVAGNDLLTQVLLKPGVNAVDYNFCEEPPASISGMVHADVDGNCMLDPGEVTLEGVTIFLLDAAGNRIASTKTAPDGTYSFTNLAPNTIYGIEEVTPAGYYDSGDMVGSAGGVAGNDLLTQILLKPGVDAIDYNFCEAPPASLSGRVYVDDNNNGKDDSEPAIPGVTLTLLDANGNPTSVTTQTDANGNYVFTGLAPGVYGVAETQPAGYFDGLDSAGSAGGTAENPGDRITGATLKPLQVGKNYNFGELPGGSISGYVFRDGLPIGLNFGQTQAQVDIEQLRPGARGTGDLPIPGVTLALADGQGNLLRDAKGNTITAVTDAKGYYQFTNLTPGTYTVLEQHPAAYTDGVDTPGSTGGTAANKSNRFAPVLLNVNHQNDAIVGINVVAGTRSIENNFSEVEFSPSIPPPPPLPPPPLPPLTQGPPGGYMLQPGAAPLSPVPPVLPVSYASYFGGGIGSAQRYSWHLSVIDAGSPRGDQRQGGEMIPVSEARFDVFQAMAPEMQESKFILRVEGDANPRALYFGMQGATPIAGDFDGDGRAEVGVFHRGQWFIDLNGNGIWDAEDLWAELGGPADRPIVGDWDGDGKTDIGIYGPKWRNDERAVQRDPGLPDADNAPTGKHKNIPPQSQDAAAGVRKLKKSSQGRMRADLVDHVFFYGAERDTPLAGDWNGDGIASIGIFRNGLWMLDDNGDGQWLPDEAMAEFGQAGDLPVIGDFNGDGIDELAVFRAGVWYIDINNNHKQDAEDLVIEHGGPNDRPIVGDWNGDGIDEIGLYQDGESLREKQ